MNRIVKQAEVSKTAATANIECKINVLESWLLNGIPWYSDASGAALLSSSDHKILDYFPKSLRQFNAWDGSQNCEHSQTLLPKFTANGNDTIRNRAVLRDRVETVIASLRKIAISQMDNSSFSKVKSLENELARSKEKIEYLLGERITERIELRDLRRKNKILRSQLDGHQMATKNLHEELVTEIEYLRKTNAELVKKSRKVRHLEPTNGDK